MATATTTESRRWISASEAARILEGDVRTFHRLVSLGLVGTKALPGARRLYDRADVVRIVRQSIRPATAGL